jgi:hypothetical protein
VEITTVPVIKNSRHKHVPAKDSYLCYLYIFKLLKKALKGYQFKLGAEVQLAEHD